jgi:hypothetical protein
MATGERQSVAFPVDSGFATARQSRERAIYLHYSNPTAATNFVTGRVSIENEMIK